MRDVISNLSEVELPNRAEPRRKCIIRILAYAVESKYFITKVDPNNGLIRLSKTGVDINIYSSTFTVTTELKHPNRSKKTQLHRKNLSEEQIKMVIDNPRAHTGKGYYRK